MRTVYMLLGIVAGRLTRVKGHGVATELRTAAIRSAFRKYAAIYEPLFRRGWDRFSVELNDPHARVFEVMLWRCSFDEILPVFADLPAHTSLTLAQLEADLDLMFGEAMESSEVEIEAAIPRLDAPAIEIIEDIVLQRRPDLADAAGQLRVECLERVWLEYAPPNLGGGIEPEIALEIGGLLWEEMAVCGVDESGRATGRGAIVLRAARGLPVIPRCSPHA